MLDQFIGDSRLGDRRVFRVSRYLALALRRLRA